MSGPVWVCIYMGDVESRALAQHGTGKSIPCALFLVVSWCALRQAGSARRRKSLQEQQAKFDAWPRLEHKLYTHAPNRGGKSNRIRSKVLKFAPFCLIAPISFLASLFIQKVSKQTEKASSALESVFSRLSKLHSTRCKFHWWEKDAAHLTLKVFSSRAYMVVVKAGKARQPAHREQERASSSSLFSLNSASFAFARCSLGI